MEEFSGLDALGVWIDPEVAASYAAAGAVSRGLGLGSCPECGREPHEGACLPGLPV
jgi:hypothetical protein